MKRYRIVKETCGENINYSIERSWDNDWIVLTSRPTFDEAEKAVAQLMTTVKREIVGEY